jgi:autotransporter-associated beta strand protein
MLNIVSLSITYYKCFFACFIQLTRLILTVVRWRKILKLRALYIGRQLLPLLVIIPILLLPDVAKSQTKTYTAGAYIIDMGQPTQTIANGLKPYGLVYALLKSTIPVPVDWSINSAKAKDGIDFTVNSKNYKGGPFIIPSELITSAVLTLFTTWRAAGVIVDGPIPVGFTAPLYKTLSKWPRAFLDLDNDDKITPYYANAGIPSGSYVINANPTMLPQCGSISGELDVYILPHADPDTWDATWITALQNFINNGGAMWAGCHAVSVMENLPGCNFLSNGGLIPFGSHGDGTPPYTYISPGNPLMQFIGILDAATQNGSEQIYVPAPSGWRATTTISVYDPNYVNAAITYPNTAAIIAYGPAFGSKGLIMYEAGHRLDQSGNIAAQVAAQRAYFDFLLNAGTQTQLMIIPPDISNQNVSACTGIAFSVSPAGAPANTTYTWSAPTGTGFTGGSAQATQQTSISQTLNNITSSPVTALYTITPQIGGCIGHTFTLTVTVNTLPTISVTPSAVAICLGNSTTLTAIGASSYSWSPATGLSATTGATVTANPTSSTTYTVTGTDANGCINTTTVSITVNPTPTTTDVTICQGGSASSLTSSSTCPNGSSTTTVLTNAGTGASTTAGAGTIAWTNPSNSISNNGIYATCAIKGPGTKTSEYLKTSNYGFTIPGAATIIGITVIVGRFEDNTANGNDVKDVGVNLLKAGAISGLNKADLVTEWPKTTVTTATYGGSSDLWGTTWTPTDINLSTFGVTLNASSDNDRTASVDYIQISVTYTVPGTLNWYIVSSGGSSIGTGSPFNPVGVTGSGLPNTNTPGTYPFYAECSSVAGCRTLTNYVINPKPSITAISSSVCSGTAFSVTPVNDTNGVVPSGTTYSWSAPAGTGFTGGSSGSASSSIGGTLTNTSTGNVIATYNVTPLSGSCTGATFTVTVTLGQITGIWQGGTIGSETDWNTASNWSCGGVPTATTDVTIPSGRTYYPVIGALNGMCQTITDMANASISGTGSLQIYGYGGIAIANISGNSTISCPVIMPSAGTVTVAANMTLTISGIISGATTNITKLGSGTLSLSGANTYVGATSVSVGILNIQNAQGTGTVAGGVTVLSGASMELEGGITIGNEALSLAGEGIPPTNSSGALRNVSGNNIWAGAIMVAANNTRINSASGSLTLSNTVNLQGNILFIQGASKNNNLISNVISGGAGSITKVGVGTWTLSGANTFTGGVSLYNGTLNINNPSALGTVAGAFTIGGVGNVVTIDNTSGSAITTGNYPMSWNDDFTFTGSNSLNLGIGSVGLQESRQVTVSANTLTVGGIMSGPGMGLTKLGAGILTLNGANSYDGATTITAGELRLNPTVNTTPSSQFVLNSGTLSTINIAGGRAITNSSTLKLTDNSSLNLGSNIHTLTFANSSGAGWTSGKILTINGWQGSWNGTTGTAGKIFTGNSTSGLTAGQIAQVRFYNDTKYFPAIQLTTGELVPTADNIITGTISGSPFCAGSAVSIPFTYTLSYNFPIGTTTFIAQLSDASGSFASPVSFGTIASDASGAQTIINATIPLATLTGTLYRIRVVSDTPATSGTDNGSNLIINATPSIPAQTITICNGTSPNFTPVNNFPTTIAPAGTTYTWTAPVINPSGSITGASAQPSGQLSINQVLTNTTSNAATATCTVTPTSGSCVGSTFELTVTVYGYLSAGISGGTTPICYNTAPGTFTATGSGGTGSYTYLWYKDGASTAITTQTYAPGNLNATSSFYCAITSGSCGTVNTSTTTITVNANPTITGTLSVCAGTTTQLTGSGTPTNPVAWVSASPGIATVDNSGLVTGVSAGTSMITYTDINGCTSSATVTVNALPVITTQPTNQLDCEGHIVSFNVVATGSGLTYTWQRKKPSGSFADIPLTGEPNVSYPSQGTIRLENVGNSDAPDGTQYRVVINNSDNCTVTSNIAILSVNEITGINPTSTNVTICQGQNYSYQVTTNYPSNVVSYQWKKWNNSGQWDYVIDGGHISGSTTDHLVFTGATPSESGKYKVTVVFHSSGADCNVTSDTRDRTLNVNPTPSCSITGSGTVYAGSTGNIFTSSPDPSDNVIHLWSISENGTISGPTNGTTVSVTATGPGAFTLADNISRFGCTSLCTYVVSVIDLPCSITPTASVANGTSTTYSAPTGMDTYSWSITGNGSITSGLTNQAVTVLAGNNCNTYTLTVTISKSGASSTCSQTIAVTDNLPPTFSPEEPFSFCVENLFTATYVSNDIIINPDPDYYLFKAGNTSLDLDPSKYIDNCCVVPADQFTIRWEVVFSSGEPAISGTGQPSTYTVGGIPKDIKLWGDGVSFTSLTHTIRYWLKDCNGNEVATPIDQTITIKPRPNIIKGN